MKVTLTEEEIKFLNKNNKNKLTNLKIKSNESNTQRGTNQNA